MSGRRSLAAAALATTAAALGACGNGKSGPPDDAVRGARATVARYFAALARADAGGSCAQLSERSREKLAEYGADALKLRGARSCDATIGALLQSTAGPGLRATARAARVTRVAGERERLEVRVAGVDRPLELVRAGSGYAIESEPLGEPDKQ
jgi:hypothetical protein